MSKSSKSKSWFGRMFASLPSGRRIRRSIAKLFRYSESTSDYAQSPLSLPPKLTRLSYLNPWYWFLWCLDFLFRWILTRPFSSLFPAIPALLGLGSIGILFIEQNLRGSVHRKSVYLQRLSSSEAKEDWKAALLQSQVLTDLSPNNKDWDFESAAIHVRLGNLEQANETMAELADKHGSGRAAYWIATNRFSLDTIQIWSEENHVEFKKYMKLALESPESAGMEQRQLTMAKYLLGAANLKEALAYIVPLLPQHPELALSAAIISKSLGSTSESKRFAATATVYLQSALEKKSNDVPLRTSLAQSLIMQDREEEAYASLVAGYQNSQDQSLLMMQSEALLIWAQRLKTAGKDDETLLQRLNLINKAVEISPNQPNALDSLFELAMECRNSKNDQVRNLLTTALNGADPSVLHFVRGTIATIDGDMEKAEKYLSLAAKNGKAMPGVLNNLAVAISGKKDGDQEEALRFSEMALSQMPDHPYLLETRGQILAKLNRPKDAIRDLEVAVQTEALAPLVLPTLIECYRKMDLPEMEEHYRKMMKKD